MLDVVVYKIENEEIVIISYNCDMVRTRAGSNIFELITKEKIISLNVIKRDITDIYVNGKSIFCVNDRVIVKKHRSMTDEDKEYCEKNKDRIRETKKNWYSVNKKEILLKMKEKYKSEKKVKGDKGDDRKAKRS